MKGTMKKIALLIVLTFSLVAMSGAQEIGARFGQTIAGHVAVDAVFSLGQFSRVHADVSFGSGGVSVEALWNPLYRQLGKNEALHWYVGVGPYLFLGSPFGLGILGEIGLEYHFKDAPIAVGADWRPAFRLIEDTDFLVEGFGFNIRYVIGKE